MRVIAILCTGSVPWSSSSAHLVRAVGHRVLAAIAHWPVATMVGLFLFVAHEGMGQQLEG